MQTGLTDLNGCNSSRCSWHLTVRKEDSAQLACLQRLILVHIHTSVQIKWNMNSNLLSCAVWLWYLLFARDKQYLFPRYHSAKISLHWLLHCLLIINDSFYNVFSDQAAQTCFRTCPCIIRFAVLTPSVLNDIRPTVYVSMIKHEMYKICFCRPAIVALSIRNPFSD